ncbi:alpha/beta hydrolase [Microbacterium sp. M3]|uniref:Alpha/beta hydrolase n=1 Tax=Microbacterium arthrosphaerae TaxID=792652 RepID=A0ABU4H117_9MICO|nr:MULTISPECIES: alpha/beta hydrolase [Microbacterium]MDW4572390.1 alpha/beta hydrolase [Microbacterium arthrosphaerae]MDW7606245.1 alpha/beta hydrolase [Microbacterium sp. M3]
MHIILIPGLWLDASSWGEVTPALETGGHRTHPLTMPGVGVSGAESAAIGIAEWVAAAVAEIDRLDGPVVLVGHSGGGNVAYGALDARPDRVQRIVFLDTFPPGEGGSISEFPVVDGVVPFPGWDFFDESDVADLDPQTRTDAQSRARSVPERVPTDPIRLTDERRRAVPATIITGTVSAAQIREIIEKAPPWAAELAALEQLDIVELGSEGDATGHWPQFSRPGAVAEAILATIG